MSSHPRPLPCGSWPTPVTADMVVRSSTSVGTAYVEGGVVHWSELRPQEGGRTQVVRLDADGTRRDVLPEGANARTAVHEYGGGAWWVREGTVWYVDWSDQRLRCLHQRRPGQDPEETRHPETLTDELEDGSVRWADGDVHPADGRIAVVRETHPAGTTAAKDVVNEVVVLGPDGQEDVVVDGHDFVAAPRWSPDGESLAWLEWDHPDMPWDSAVLKVRSGDQTVVVAGGAEEGACLPQWAPDGALWFCTDADDWWSLHRWTPDGGSQRVLERPGDVGVPMWTLGQSRFAFLDEGRVVAAISHEGRDRLVLREADGSVRDLDVDVSHVRSVSADGDTVVVVAASPTRGLGVLRLTASSGGSDVRRLDSDEETLDPAMVSAPQHVEFPGGDGRPTYANFYPPTNADHEPTEGELPPVIVMIHGGPTSAAVPALALGVQFWTTRGFAVVDVDYGGSTGYGRAYRNRLRGQWGVLDVGDCVAVVGWLGEQGLVDPGRALIRGGSAGGFTTLMALATSEVFAAGADLFGVADVEALALETHKFESRYLDRLIAPYPEGREVYVARSPLSHLDGLTSPLVVLQGDEDKVVPPAQSEMVVEALRAKKVPVAYRLYAGEQHGFRRVENIVDALHSELSFYAQVLGFPLPEEEGVPTLAIENLPRS